MQVAQTLEVDAVTVHETCRGGPHQQQIELFETLGHAWQPTFCDPAILWSDTDFGVDAPVMVVMNAPIASSS